MGRLGDDQDAEKASDKSGQERGLRQSSHGEGQASFNCRQGLLRGGVEEERLSCDAREAGHDRRHPATPRRYLRPLGGVLGTLSFPPPWHRLVNWTFFGKWQ